MQINKKAYLEYNFDYEIEVGLVLKGDEVKSLRQSTPSLQSVYGYIEKNEIFIRNLSLSKAKQPDRNKKLLLHRKQINKIMGLFSNKSQIIIPIELYEKKGYFKMKIGVGNKMNKVDHREAIKNKEMKKDMKYFV